MRDPIASARAMDQARANGMPDELLTVHLAIVAARRNLAPWPHTQALRDYVADPRTRQVDEVTWAAARSRLQG